MYAGTCTEPNEEHRAANAGQLDTAALLDVAGRLFAGQLIAGTPGYALPGPASPTAKYPSPADLADDPARTRRVLDSRLFVGTSEGRLAPAHRQIAEFLAARHLARLIAEHHISVRRVLALLVGFDGELLPSFRNLAAWLAVRSPPTRRRLAELHPSGLVYAADRDTFSPDEKRVIVANLHREADWNPWCLRSMRRTGLGPIISRDVEDVIRQTLADEERGGVHQQYVMMLLQALVDGDPLPALGPHAEDIVRDTTWREGVRCAALDVLVAYHGKGASEAAALDRLFGDVADGELEDRHDELIGILLKAGYPDALTPDDVLRHLRPPKHTAIPGEFADFWVTHVPKESSTEQAAMLLDRLAENFGAYRLGLLPTDDGLTRLHEFPIRLLGALLDRDDADISVKSLLEWLTVCAETFPGLPESLANHIRLRLQRRRGLLAELLPAAVEDCVAKDDPERCLAAIDHCLFGARPFPYGTLCIEQALAAENPIAVDFYLSELAACFASGRHAAGTTIDGARAPLSRRPELIDRFDRAMSGPDAQQHRSPNPLPDTPAQRDWQRRMEAWQSDPGAATDVLHSAAEAYLAVSENNEGATPTERLRTLVGGRRDLADALLEGFSRTIRRDDPPTPRQVVRLAARGRIHHVSLPVLAALDHLERAEQLALDDLDDRPLRLAVTLLYTFPPHVLTDDPPKPPRQYRPKWLLSLLNNNSGLVADVLDACVLTKLDLAIEPAAELKSLVSDANHAAVARLVAPRLLRAFPALDSANACACLAWTLKAALLHADRSVLSNILAARLGDDETASGQRPCWLAAAFLIEPDRHRSALLDDTSDGLFDVVFAGRAPANFTNMAPGDLELLTTRLADTIARRGLPETGEHTMSRLIGQLADAATPDATRSLAGLASHADLAPRLPLIDAARHTQARARREREFRHPDIRRVAQTLNNNTPSNPADFKALLLDVLDDIVVAIEDGNANGRQTYWNVNPQSGKPREPRPENACRNSLVGLLEARTASLGVRVDLQREATVVDDKRPDIRASFGGFALPFEIKRSCHPRLWSAIDEQLVPLYTREPASDGHGVYIVFWFGQTERCRPTPLDGWTPSTALELATRLQGC